VTTAGVDLFHCSQRRFWEPEFEGSSLNLAGWTKKLTGKPAIAVGSITLNEEFTQTFRSAETAVVYRNRRVAGTSGMRRVRDLVAIGRSLIVNPFWPALVQRDLSAAPSHKDETRLVCRISCAIQFSSR
jgi:2,4-dienoyl-CoA reductase-like NADH-dependent reductase (Old Yellow Enzyme family)